MPKLYIEEYRAAFTGKTIFIACREGILRDHFAAVIADIKFLNRQGVKTRLFHNVSNRFANQKLFSEISAKLPQTRQIRVPVDQDFYQYVLDYRDSVEKIIFLERKYLVDDKGHRINSLTTSHARAHATAYQTLIANINFRQAIEQICRKIDGGYIQRVHIIPAGRQSIKHELFTIEGSGTLIANNFTEAFSVVESEDDIRMVTDILKLYQRHGYLKPRSEMYIRKRRANFYTAKIDGIVVGCAEKISLDEMTAELGALAISTKFRKQRVGVFLINTFLDEMFSQGYRTVVSLTGNPRLKALYLSLGFSSGGSEAYADRCAQSPDKSLFIKHLQP